MPTPLVEFQDVTFSIGGSPAPIISHLNLAVAPGETLVLLGESG
jgi:ABC-type multidrug transport system fused ATPase/permease subunit